VINIINKPTAQAFASAASCLKPAMSSMKEAIININTVKINPARALDSSTFNSLT